jgi:putative Holliday junction resolvase
VSTENKKLFTEEPASICALAFDFGTQRIGVAVGQSITRTASPLIALKANDGIPNWDHIAALITEWQPQQLIIGLPLNMDGSESEMSARAKKFANRLHGRFGLPAQLWDERLSSFEARGEMRARGAKNIKENNYRDGKVDSLSACLILESWFAR